MGDLRSILTEFMNTTNEILILLENENYDNINDIFNKRELIIETIKSMEYEQSEFVNICSDLHIVELNEKLGNMMNIKSLELKSNMEKIRLSRNANLGYIKKSHIDSMFFNKKV